MRAEAEGSEGGEVRRSFTNGPANDAAAVLSDLQQLVLSIGYTEESDELIKGDRLRSSHTSSIVREKENSRAQPRQVRQLQAFFRYPVCCIETQKSLLFDAIVLYQSQIVKNSRKPVGEAVMSVGH